MLAHGERRGRESSGAEAIEQRDLPVVGVGPLAGDGEVIAAVAVEIGHRKRLGRLADRDVDRGPQPTEAVGLQHRDPIRAGVGDGEVETTDAPKMPGDDRDGIEPHRVVCRRSEPAVAEIGEDGDPVGGGFGDHEIGSAIALDGGQDHR